MYQISYTFYNSDKLNDFLSSSCIKDHVTKSKSTLIQIFTSKADEDHIKQLNNSILKLIPNATIIGTTTSGEISEGNSINSSTVLSFSFFEDTDLKVIALNCPYGSEKEIGVDLCQKINDTFLDIKGVLILATTQTMDGGTLLDGMRENMGDFPLFGGGAGSYDNNHSSFVFYGEELFYEGLVAVVFSGSQLHIDVYTYIGWQALSKEMTITEVGNSMLIKKIDAFPAGSIYEKYLGISYSANFFENTIEFPLMLQRDGGEVARIPVDCDPDGSMHLVADAKVGDKVRLAYGSPESIITNSYIIQNSLRKFSPQGIILYTCNCRQIFLQKSVQFETKPLESIASTSGFYTYGEFYGRGKNINLLNATMVAVGIREGDATEKKVLDKEIASDIGEQKHIELTARLVHFIHAVVSELEEVNVELQTLSDTDQLTQLLNRGKIDSLFKSEIEKAKKNNNVLSIVLLDIDHFKAINDLHGHHSGDKVLIQVANALKNNTREKDLVGRWGGEEFMIILQETTLERAKNLAERIREAISKIDFGDLGVITASFGVVSVDKFEESIQVYKRVDAALYQAKNSGRNKVICQ